MQSSKLKIFAASAAVAMSIVFGMTAFKWSGSLYAYILMTLAFWGLLAVGILHLRGKNVGFALLAILLWVGYWLKLSIHLLNDIPWVEPIGRFDFSAGEWDAVAIVSAVGALAVAVVGLLWSFLLDRDRRGEPKTTVIWRPGLRTPVYLFVSVVTIAVVLLNEIYGLSHNGLRPAVDLIWPLQGLFSWMFVIGIALMVLVVFNLDADSGCSMVLATLVFTGIVVLLGVSQYSRGIAALQILPLFVSLLLWYKYIGGLNKVRLIVIFCVMLFGVIASIVGGQGRRVQTLPEYSPSKIDAAAVVNGAVNETVRGLPRLLSRLVIDRWVGLEGVMAVVAYPDKGVGLFDKLLAERRAKDKVDTYTAVISQSGFYDTDKYQFATIPGVFAFLYYANSLVVVFFGSMVLGSIVIASERLVRWATGNIFVSTQVGFFSAMLVIQLGAGGVVQPGSVLIFTLVFASLAGFIGRHYIGRVIAV